MVGLDIRPTVNMADGVSRRTALRVRVGGRGLTLGFTLGLTRDLTRSLTPCRCPSPAGVHRG